MVQLQNIQNQAVVLGGFDSPKFLQFSSIFKITKICTVNSNLKTVRPQSNSNLKYSIKCKRKSAVSFFFFYIEPVCKFQLETIRFTSVETHRNLLPFLVARVISGHHILRSESNIKMQCLLTRIANEDAYRKATLRITDRHPFNDHH